jgi:hypothetical protein
MLVLMEADSSCYEKAVKFLSLHSTVLPVTRSLINLLGVVHRSVPSLEVVLCYINFSTVLHLNPFYLSLIPKR